MLTNPHQYEKPVLQFIDRMVLVGTFLGAAILMWFVLYLIGCYIELLVLLGRSW
ncbi:hypothetical protein [Thalassovita sp.]|uniref:hypothetical protein n=1 Tax=Thalassovita sp. TaxID=1979401 RepID=UPI002B2666B5|nr:hypothetical protein [Thalassovita sp.]